MLHPRHRRSIRGAFWALMVVIALSGLFVAPNSAAAQTTAAGSNPLQEPMKFARVRSDDPACQPDCPEWIEAQGKIELGSALAFSRVIAHLDDRRLPIFINSPGGSVGDALAMGRLIRSKKLAVAVARTERAPCPSQETACDQHLGKAIAFGAACISACPLILAGGVERYASPLSYIAVHQVLMMQTTQLVIRKAYEVEYRPFDGTPQVDNHIGAYLEDMGVGSSVMEAIMNTPNKEIRQLNWQELVDSNLVTMQIDQMSAMVGGIGVNGLAGVPAASTLGHEALFVAKGSWPFALPVNRKVVALQANFAYRRGGGVIETTLSTHDSVSGADADVRGRGFAMKLTPGDVEYRLMKAINGDPIQQTIPLAQFCKLSSGGRVAIEPFDGPATNVIESGALANPHEPPIAIDIQTIEGMDALFEEACSPLSLSVAEEVREPPTHRKPRRDLIIIQ